MSGVLTRLLLDVSLKPGYSSKATENLTILVGCYQLPASLQSVSSHVVRVAGVSHLWYLSVNGPNIKCVAITKQPIVS